MNITPIIVTSIVTIAVVSFLTVVQRLAARDQARFADRVDSGTVRKTLAATGFPWKETQPGSSWFLTRQEVYWSVTVHDGLATVSCSTNSSGGGSWTVSSRARLEELVKGIV